MDLSNSPLPSCYNEAIYPARACVEIIDDDTLGQHLKPKAAV
jgi:hypothetical protein